MPKKNAKKNFYGKVGLKNKADYSISGTETSALITDLGTTITPSSPNASIMGCTRTGEQTIPNDSYSIDDTWFALAAFDGGLRFVKSSSFAWTIGVFGEVSLNHTKLTGYNVAMYARNDGNVLKYVTAMPMDKLGIFSVGLKLTCEFGIKSRL